MVLNIIKLVELPLDSCVDGNLFLQAAADGVPCDFQIEPALEVEPEFGLILPVATTLRVAGSPVPAVVQAGRMHPPKNIFSLLTPDFYTRYV